MEQSSGKLCIAIRCDLISRQGAAMLLRDHLTHSHVFGYTVQ